MNRSRQPPMSARSAGFTMIQTAGLVALAGSMLAVMFPTFLRTVHGDKLEEATQLLQHMHDAVDAYYRSTHAQGKTWCLPPAAGPTPSHAGPMQTEFVVDGAAPDDATVWTALRFSPGQSVHFRYSFVPRFTGCDGKQHGHLATLRAEGDLDGDGSLSLFERRFAVDREHKVLEHDALFMRDRVE